MENPDAALGVEFFTKSVQNKTKSEEEGRPIFEDREFVRMRFPGDNKRELVAPAHESHFDGNTRTQTTYAQRFAASYAAFKDGTADFVSGTPLRAMPSLTDAKIAELNALSIRTVEQLAGMADAFKSKLGMGGYELSAEAQRYLDTAAKSADTGVMQTEIEALKAQIASMQGTQVATPDPFDGMSDEDLKNMIRDAGGEVPRGNAKRETLVSALQAIADQKEAVA